ncbi:MAG: type II toxin-antitoxin system Phd/YefM family antitoxin [Asticcacaulis sp.]
MRTLSSREFNQDVGAAKRAARVEPVFVTDRGRPTHVLLSIDAYRQMSGGDETIIDLLAMPDSVEVDFDAARSGSGWDRKAGL